MLEKPHGLISPENRLDCSKEDIEHLYNQLPPKQDCIIKDLEMHNGDLFFDYKGPNGTTFAIEWDESTQNFYASPIRLVEELILALKEDKSHDVVETLSPETTNSIDIITFWIHKKLAQFVDEMGRAPEFVKISFESGEEMLAVRKKVSKMTASAILPVQKIIPKEKSPIEEPELEPKPEEESIEESPVLINFNLALFVAAVKLLTTIMPKKQMAAESGLSEGYFYNLARLKIKNKLSPRTIKALKNFLINYKETICQLLNNNQEAQAKLTEREFDILIELTNSDGFSEKTIDENDETCDEINPQYALIALRLMSGIIPVRNLAKEIGVTGPSLGNYIKGKTTKPRRPTLVLYETWLLESKDKILQNLQIDGLVSKTISPEDKKNLEDYLSDYKKEESEPTDYVREMFKRDFRPEIAFAAIKLACAASSNKEIADEIGMNSENISRYVKGKVKNLQTNTSEKIQAWMLDNLNRLWELQKIWADTSLTAEEATILDEFLFELKSFAK